MNPNDFMWSTKYRPSTVDDVILPSRTHQLLKSYCDQGNTQTLLLWGSSGAGKTTAAKCLANDLGAVTMFVNASMNGNIDTLRSSIYQFASALSLDGKRRIVIMDEADALTSATQDAMRAFMEDFGANASMILTCNFKNRIIDAVQSRCVCIGFDIHKGERAQLCKQFLARLCTIAEKEGVPYSEAALAKIILRYFPDWRRVLNACQSVAIRDKELGANLLASEDQTAFDELFVALKEKKWTDMRAWVATNSYMAPEIIIRSIYDCARTKIQQQSLPELVIILADGQYQLNFSADKEICLVAMLTKIMGSVQFN